MLTDTVNIVGLNILRPKRGKITTYLSCLALLGIVLLLTSCMQVRLLTYPESFTWIGEEDVQSTMHSMAQSMKNLNTLVREEQSPSSHRDDILRELDNLEYVAASLSVSVPLSNSDRSQVPATNHLLIDEHMDDFLEDILRARVQAEMEPANYFGVGKLTGSCTACHRLR